MEIHIWQIKYEELNILKLYDSVHNRYLGILRIRNQNILLIFYNAIPGIQYGGENIANFSELVEIDIRGFGSNM